MAALPLKGMILAAGFGTRLKPITDRMPKPLVPFFGAAPLHLALFRLKLAGISEIAINSHYMADQIHRSVRPDPFDLDVRISNESAILGSGGCYAVLRDWIGNSPIVSLSGDIISDLDVNAVWKTHQQQRAVATMVVTPTHIEGTTPIYCQGNRVIGIGGPPDGFTSGTFTVHTFTAMHILEPRFMDLLPTTGPSSIIDQAYLLSLARGQTVAAHIHSGFWEDIGTPLSYWRAHERVLQHIGRLSPDQLFGSLGVLEVLKRQGKELKVFNVSKTVIIGEIKMGTGSRLGPFAVSVGPVEVGEGSTVSHALLLPGTSIGAHEEVHDELMGQGIQITLGVDDLEEHNPDEDDEEADV